MTTSTMQVLGALALELKPGSIPCARHAVATRCGSAVANWSRTTSPRSRRKRRHWSWPWSARTSMRSNCCVRAGRCIANSTSSRRARPGRPSHASSPSARDDGQLPGALAPSADFAGGPLRLLPFVLGGDAGVVARVGDAFERELMERGMAGAATALAAQDLFGLQVEHARYLTVHDLAALMAMQYEHAGLAPLWPVIEAALLAPGHEEWLDAPPEPLVHYAGGEARIALLSPAAWRARHAAEPTGDSEHARSPGACVRALPGAPAPVRRSAGRAWHRGDVRALPAAMPTRAQPSTDACLANSASYIAYPASTMPSAA